MASVIKAIDATKLDNDLKLVGDAIRVKRNSKETYSSAEEMKIAIENINSAPLDPHTLLLLHGEFMEDSSKYKVPLSNGGVTISTAQSKFGNKSLYFDGNSWINFPQKYAPYMDKDFTIDWWEYCMTSDSNHQSRYFSTDAGGPYKTLGLLLGHLGKQTYCGDGWSMISGAEMFNIVQNQWVHWATVRHGNTLTTYRNGKKFAQTSIVGSIPYDEKTMHCIGGWRYSSGQKWIGYMDEFRISDIARWTSDFTPPTAPYDGLEHCKEEQEKIITVVENGSAVVTPDEGKTLSKATVNVNVPTGPDISDATATASEVFTGKTAYIASGKVTGSFDLTPEMSAQDTKIAAIKEALKGKGAGKSGVQIPGITRVETIKWTPEADTNIYTIDQQKVETIRGFIIEGNPPLQSGTYVKRLSEMAWRDEADSESREFKDTVAAGVCTFPDAPILLSVEGLLRKNGYNQGVPSGIMVDYCTDSFSEAAFKGGTEYTITLMYGD